MCVKIEDFCVLKSKILKKYARIFSWLSIEESVSSMQAVKIEEKASRDTKIEDFNEVCSAMLRIGHKMRLIVSQRKTMITQRVIILVSLLCTSMQAVKIEEKASRDTKIEYFCVPCWFLYAPLFIPSSFKIEDFNQATKCA